MIFAKPGPPQIIDPDFFPVVNQRAIYRSVVLGGPFIYQPAELNHRNKLTHDTGPEMSIQLQIFIQSDKPDAVFFKIPYLVLRVSTKRWLQRDFSVLRLLYIVKLPAVPSPK